MHALSRPLGPALLLGFAAAGCAAPEHAPAATLWPLYEQSLRGAKYVDLTHAITPTMPVHPAFGPARFSRAADPGTGAEYTYEGIGAEATHLDLATDQLGTQLDPPAHFSPRHPAIDELPPTFCVRPLVVIPIVDEVARDPGHHLSVADVEAWEAEHGRIPPGAVVFVRSDWSKDWPDPALATRRPFPGVSLPALKLLHEERRILLHGHEPLDTDTTENWEGEVWLLTNGYTQAEGLAHLDQVPETGALVAIGFAKIAGGTGGLARFIAICPADWPHGVSVDEVPGAPLPAFETPLRWDTSRGLRVREPASASPSSSE